MRLRRRIARYQRSAARRYCPDCGAPLLVAYEGAETGHGLEAVSCCAADCGYQERPVRIVHGHTGSAATA
jgi:hypothetical protein